MATPKNPTPSNNPKGSIRPSPNVPLGGPEYPSAPYVDFDVPPEPSDWMPSNWEPQYEWGAKPETEFTSITPVGVGDWIITPSTSHIARFQFTDARESSFLSEIGPYDGASQLHVVFRDLKFGIETDEYAYYFQDHEFGANIAAQLASSPHPYGEVLYPLVRLNPTIPYTPLSRKT